MVNGYAPTSLKEALSILSEHKVVPYGGGTDLVVENRPNVVYLFLGKIPELRNIVTDDTFVRIGANVTFTQALESNLVPKLMKEAVSRIAAPAIRNAGTFGGNLGNGSAKADTVLIDFVADAKLRLASVRGERTIDVSAFYKGRKELDLASDELIIEVLLPKTGLERYYYQKIGGRQALVIARVSFAGVFEEKDGVILNCAAAFGAVAPTVLRYKDLEAKIIGKTIAEAKAMRDDYIATYDERMVFTEGRVSSKYRKTVCKNLLGAFLSECGI